MKNLVIVLFISVQFAALAQTAEQKGLSIAQMAKEADKGYASSEASLKMILTNRNGQESERSLQYRTLEVEDDGDKSMIIFNSPRDVEGTASLTFTHKKTADDQWLYLPSIKRVKRISSDNKSGPFMGSEFAYEDLSSQEVEKYTYKFMREDNLDGTQCLVVERYPVDPKSGYSKQIVWYNQSSYRIEKMDFYDRRNALLKTLDYLDYTQYLGKYWRATEMAMVNHQTGKKTRLIFENYRFKTGLSEVDFTQNSLLRAGK